MDRIDSDRRARRLGGALEPVIGSVYFAPEAHRAYAALGFEGSPNAGAGIEWPDGVAYATSRGSILGQVEPAVVAAAFGVFQPERIAASVTEGWKRTDAATIFAARDTGALAQLERVLGRKPDGLERVEELLRTATDGLPIAARPLAAGLLHRAPADHPLGSMFRLGDVLREFRGDGHNAAWVAAGLDGCEISLMTELYWGLRTRTYSRSRSWSEEQFDAAEARLEARGWMDNGALTEAGVDARERIEEQTDALVEPVMARLGEAGVDELIERLTPWGRAVRAADGYPASGPHEIAERIR